MKTFKDKNPSGSNLNRDVLSRFNQQQHQILQLLGQVNDNIDLQKIKVPISISKWIKIRLGDTFRFVIYHNERHIQQADRVLKAAI